MNPCNAAGTPSPLQIHKCTNDHATWVTITGEADLSNHHLLEAELVAIDLDGTKDVHLWLANLFFCDVHALCDLLAFATEVRQDGGVVVLHDADPTVQKLTRILAADHLVTFG